MRYLPNIITIFRFILVLPTAWALLEGRFVTALALFLVAGISDGVDGYLAKRFNWQSKIGGIMDPLADKFLLVTTLLILGYNGLLPWWLVAAAIFRDILIVVGATIYYFWVEHISAQPNLLSKLNTVLQIILVFWVVLTQFQPAFDHGITNLLVWLTSLTIIVSGLQYILVWGTRAWKMKSRRKS